MQSIVEPSIYAKSPEPAARPGVFELDLARLAALGLVTPDLPSSRVAEEFRLIKRPLISNTAGRGRIHSPIANLIMVTSALAGEGKSFTAVNLAMSMAMEVDNTVLLVDADVGRSSLPAVLGFQAERGFLDVLRGDAVELPDVLIRTNVERLSILPCGKKYAHATELLASDAMKRLLEEIALRYSDRIVIFDSPPLLVTTEARVLATHMGQIVMVVEAERTSHDEVKQALATIELCAQPLLVLNKVRSVSLDAYGYGHGYGS